MSEVTFSDFIETVLGGIPVDNGGILRRGVSFFETPYEYIGEWNTTALPYIIYQEEGFTHYLTKKKVIKNKGFISRKIFGQVQRLAWSRDLGIPFDKSESDNALLLHQDKMMSDLGVMQDV